MPVDHTQPITPEDQTRCFVELKRRYDAFAPRIFASLRNASLSLTAIEDIALEALTEAALRILGGEVIHNLEGWMRVATRHAVGRLRRKRLPTVPLLDENAPEADLAKDSMIADEVWASVKEGIDQLPEPIRETAVRYFLNGQTYAKIASDLGVSLASVSKRLHDARKTLCERLANFEDFGR